MTREELKLRFPNASRDFLRANADWEPQEIAILRRAYSVDLAREFNLETIAQQLDRTPMAVALKASKLGFTMPRGARIPTEVTRAKMSKASLARSSSPEERQLRSERVKNWLASNEHPRGFAGKKHTEEARRKMSEASAQQQKALGPAQRREMAKQRRMKIAANGGPMAPQLGRGTWKAAWVEIGGKRFFSRSRWEVRYGRYLELLKVSRKILDWEYEPETFWFKVKRGSTNYTPDFRVTKLSGEQEYHEVKGWMDKRSKTKIKRMRIYHPKVVLIVRDAQWFKENNRSLPSGD